MCFLLSYQNDPGTYYNNNNNNDNNNNINDNNYNIYFFFAKNSSKLGECQVSLRSNSDLRDSRHLPKF